MTKIILIYCIILPFFSRAFRSFCSPELNTGHRTPNTKPCLSSGEFAPVTRACRFPLPSGSLCPRLDRFKCPFHGPIVDRDQDGNVLGPPDQGPANTVPTSGPKKDEKRKNKKARKLRSDASVCDTSRARLEKKVFDKRALKRVSRRLDNLDQKRTKTLFSEQFNYSM